MIPPEIPAHLSLVWVAFWDLSRARRYVEGMGLGIPVSEIVHWLDLNEITTQESRTDISRLDTAMDSAWMGKNAEKLKADAAKRKPPPKPPPRRRHA